MMTLDVPILGPPKPPTKDGRVQVLGRASWRSGFFIFFFFLDWDVGFYLSPYPFFDTFFGGDLFLTDSLLRLNCNMAFCSRGAGLGLIWGGVLILDFGFWMKGWV